MNTTLCLTCTTVHPLSVGLNLLTCGPDRGGAALTISSTSTLDQNQCAMYIKQCDGVIACVSSNENWTRTFERAIASLALKICVELSYMYSNIVALRFLFKKGFV